MTELEAKALAVVRAAFTRTPQWFRVHTPQIYEALAALETTKGAVEPHQPGNPHQGPAAPATAPAASTPEEPHESDTVVARPRPGAEQLLKQSTPPVGSAPTREEPPRVAASNVPTHDEALQILSRFNTSHWRNPGKECARYSIPADPERDDDIQLARYIERCQAVEADNEALGKLCQCDPATCDGAKESAAHLSSAFEGVDELVAELAWLDITDVQDTHTSDPTGERYSYSNLAQLRLALRRAGLDLCKHHPPCRRCVECQGQEHHWLTAMPECPENGEPFIPCKHCDARAGVCEGCFEAPVWPQMSDQPLCAECRMAED